VVKLVVVAGLGRAAQAVLLLQILEVAAVAVAGAVQTQAVLADQEL
jgi:hypothetical protein